jgi:hypothetical protein
LAAAAVAEVQRQWHCVGFDDGDAKHPNTGASVGENIKTNAPIQGKTLGAMARR